MGSVQLGVIERGKDNNIASDLDLVCVGPWSITHQHFFDELPSIIEQQDKDDIQYIRVIVMNLLSLL